MDLKEYIDNIYGSSCPSIKYRINKEVLNKPDNDIEMINLQKEILEDKLVNQVFSWKQQNGYIGNRFHTAESKSNNGASEIGIRILCEKGVNKDNTVLLEALEALNNSPKFDLELSRVGSLLDRSGLGGSNLIKAAVFAYAGKENHPFVMEQIELSLKAFKESLKYCSIDEISVKYKGKFVFKENILWPCIYHIRLLAFTYNWRTHTNIKIVADAVNHLFKILPFSSEGIYLKEGSQLIAPCCPINEDFPFKIEEKNDYEWYNWFKYLELFSRTGIVQLVPALKKQTDYLKDLLKLNNGCFTKKVKHQAFSQWSAYGGLALEDNWKFPQKRINDLTFRSFLILYYSA